jgi:hypothetical protein
MVASGSRTDRWFFIQLYRWFPSILRVLAIIRPETLVRWHRAGFRRYWRWKSNSRGGRPQIQTELRVLIRKWAGRIRFGARRAFTVSCLSWGFKLRSRVSPNTWPSGVGRQAKDGAPFCVTMLRTLQPWTRGDPILAHLNFSE